MSLDVRFRANTSRMEVQVPLGENRTFTEEKIFEVHLGASLGAFISENAYANVTIVNTGSCMYRC